MGDRSRRSPYIWPTWISGLIAGDKRCWWAAWFKAHYFYDKRQQGGDLSHWKADHARMVEAVAAELRSSWTVEVEDQNKLNVEGRTATIGGCPDLVAVDPQTNDALVVDCKTGQPRDSDFWQVLIYLYLLSLKGGKLHGMDLRGEVRYPAETRVISALDVVKGREHITKAIATVAGGLELRREPSASECSRCDVGNCPDRIEATAPTLQTEEF